MPNQFSLDAPLRLLAIVEATTVNAIARNVLDFCRGVADWNGRVPGSAPIEMSIATFERSTNGSNPGVRNLFVTVARERGIAVDVVRERHRFDTRVIPALKSVVARRAPDVIVTHNVKSHFLARLCRLHRGRSWVAFHHGYTATDLKMRAYNQLDRWSLAAADQVVAVCGSFARQLERRGIPPARIAVLHNCVAAEPPADSTEALQIRRRLAPGTGERLILSVGRLSREKGHIDLISAFAALSAVQPELRAKLVIVGEGPERAAIESAIRAQGLEKEVRLEGYQSNVKPYYSAADIFSFAFAQRRNALRASGSHGGRPACGGHARGRCAGNVDAGKHRPARGAARFPGIGRGDGQDFK